MIIFIYLQFSLIAASAATSALPGPSEKAANDGVVQDRPRDSATLVNSLFRVQHGPQWQRTVSTTRCTAAPSKSRLARRARPKRIPKKATKDELSDGGATEDDQ